MATESPEKRLSGADRLRMRREAYLKARSGETTLGAELFEDLLPASASRVSQRAPQQQASKEPTAPENRSGSNSSIRGHDLLSITHRAESVAARSSTTKNDILRHTLLTSIEPLPTPDVTDDEYNPKVSIKFHFRWDIQKLAETQPVVIYMAGILSRFTLNYYLK